MTRRKEDIRTSLTLSMHNNKNIERTIKRYIRAFRQEHGIHLVISSVKHEGKTCEFEFEGERMPCKKILFWRKWIPERITFVEVVKDSQFLQELVCKKKTQLYKRFGKEYSIECISQTQNVSGDKSILLVLLATRT